MALRGERGYLACPETGYGAPEATQGQTPEIDLWRVGLTLVEGLTQQRPVLSGGALVYPTSLPEPFWQIAQGCLQPDPQQRWTLEQIRAALLPFSPVTMAKVKANPKTKELPCPFPASFPSGLLGALSW